MGTKAGVDFETGAIGHKDIVDLLTDDEIALLNSKRPPAAKIKPRKFCGARNGSGSGRPCRREAGAGTEHTGWGHCSTHLGNTKEGIKHAARLMGEEIIESHRANLVRFGGDRNDPSIANITAEQALLEEVRRSVAMVRWLEEMIGQWQYGSLIIEQEQTSFDPDQGVYEERAKGKLPESRSGNRNLSIEQAIEQIQQNNDLQGLPVLVAETSKGVSQTTDKAEWLRIYREERINGAKTAKMCIDAGIAHRMVSIAEDQGRILATAIRTTLNLLGLTPQQVELVPQIVPPILRAVATNSPIPEDLPSITSLATSTAAHG